MECYFIEVLQHVDDNDFKRILRQEPLGAYELSTHPTPVKTKRKVIMKQPDYREQKDNHNLHFVGWIQWSTGGKLDEIFSPVRILLACVIGARN